MAYMCLNIINFHAVDISERRSEEVISFFWCSVYISLWNFIHNAFGWEAYSEMENWSCVHKTEEKSNVITKRKMSQFYSDT